MGQTRSRFPVYRIVVLITSIIIRQIGFLLAMELPPPLTGIQLSRHLESKRVLLNEASNMYLPEFRKDNVIRLSISQVAEDRIDKGIMLIAEGIRELLLASRKSIPFI